MSGRYWDSGVDKTRHSWRDDDDDRRYRRRSRSRDNERHRRRRSRSRTRSRSYSRSRSRGREKRHKHKSSRRSSSREKRRSSSREKRHRREIDRNTNHNKNEKTSEKKVSSANENSIKNYEKSTESTLDGSDFAVKFGINDTQQYIGGVESEEERKKIHEQMQERLRKLQESEPKRIQPTKPSSMTNAFTPFANDGSFLEKFKEMQERFAHEQEMQQRENERLKLLPMTGRRRGGKILKTGIVEKPKRIEESTADGPKDAWSLYLQEVKRYKNATCDPDAPSRSLVK